MVDLDAIVVPPDVLRLIPKQIALELRALPLSNESETIVIAVPQGQERQMYGDLAFLIGKKIRLEPADPVMLLRAIQKHYGVSEAEMNLPRHDGPDPATQFLSVKEEEAHASPAVPGAGEGSAVPLVNRIISDAIRMGASDIHVEPYERSLRVRYRIDGILQEILRPPLSQAKPVISRLKIMADLDIAEKRRPQDGRIRVKEGERVIDIRVSSLPTDFGEKVVLRILDKSHLHLDLSRLGFEEEDLRAFKRMVRLPYGMILVTGPTGSGKTTTLYAALNHVNRPEINITTIEDPIEYNLSGINQTHVRADIGLTFAAALRSILRQDPNVIMVGEIRDSETAEIAIRAALTGHLVFSTLHTNDAPSAITRLIDMGVEPFLVASSVKLILAQRLLRRLCDDCKTPSSPTLEQLEELGVVADREASFFSSKGCPACNNLGYLGRMAVYEMFELGNGSDLIARGVGANELRSCARNHGMKALREAALLKAKRGETSLDEVIRETTA